MRDERTLPSHIFNQVPELLGVPVVNHESYRQIITSAEDHLFIWIEREANILTVNLPGRGENPVQILNLTDSPFHDVKGLVASSRGERLCVFGEDGVTVVEVPARSGGQGRLGGGATHLLCRSFPVFRKRDGSIIQKCCWFPGSHAGNQLLVLTRDGALSLYLVLEHGARLIHQVIVGGGNKISTALGETAVDFCVGRPVITEDDEGSAVWPVYVLWGDGEVFCVETGKSSNWRVNGPLEVLPEQEENFSKEACSILAIGDADGPTYLVVARVDGCILHHVVLGEPATGKLSLHIYEKVELDLGPLNQEDSGSIFKCPVSLIPDTSCRTRYIILHNSGLHQVCLPSVSRDMEELVEGEDSELKCSVEHLICTQATGDSAMAPLLGATVAYPPPTIITLRANHTIHTLKAKPNLRHRPNLSSLGDESSDVDVVTGQTNNIEERIRSIFTRESTQPQILSSADTTASQAQTLHILARATQTLHSEYINKIRKAQAELGAEVRALRCKKQNQESQLSKLEQTRTQLRANAESISERYEDIRDRGSSLSGRVEAVLSRLQAHVPGASHAQLKMARDLKLLQSKLEQIKVATEQLKEKEKYQRYQLDAVNQSLQRCALSADQTENMKAVLQGDSAAITQLVKVISSAKNDIML